MTKVYCDHCCNELKGDHQFHVSVLDKDKQLCQGCWEKWCKVIEKFFQ